MNRQPEIVSLFKQHGGFMPMNRLAELAVAAGLYSDEELHTRAMRWVAEECRKALKESDEYGLPFAGPTSARAGKDGPMWKERTLWDYGDYDFNITTRNTGLLNDYEVLSRMQAECRRRFDVAPEITRLQAAMVLTP